MLDKTSLALIAYIRCLESATWKANQGYSYSALPFNEFLLCIDFLEGEGYLKTERVSGGLVSASLTHKGLHAREFNMISFERYILDKWVDIFTALISLTALILSIIAILK